MRYINLRFTLLYLARAKFVSVSWWYWIDSVHYIITERDVTVTGSSSDVVLTASVVDDGGAADVTSDVIDSGRECRQLQCLNDAICVVDTRQHETCRYFNYFLSSKKSLKT